MHYSGAVDYSYFCSTFPRKRKQSLVDNWPPSKKGSWDCSEEVRSFSVREVHSVCSRSCHAIAHTQFNSIWYVCGTHMCTWPHLVNSSQNEGCHRIQAVPGKVEFVASWYSTLNQVIFMHCACDLILNALSISLHAINNSLLVCPTWFVLTLLRSSCFNVWYTFAGNHA